MKLAKFIDPALSMLVKKAFKYWIVVIDDGHGWLTAGKRSFDGSLRENEFNSSVEDKLTMLLGFCGIEYYSLASGWSDEKLNERSKMERNLYASAASRGKETLGISIHCDAYTKESAKGFCVYYYQRDQKISHNGKVLSRHIADAIVESDVANQHILVPRHNDGIKGANFHMLRETSGTWCLIENGFMTNDRDLAYLKRDDFRNNRTLAIFNGLYNYVINEKL